MAAHPGILAQCYDCWIQIFCLFFETTGEQPIENYGNDFKLAHR